MIKQFLFSLTLICLLVACNTGGDHDIFKPGNESSSTPPATTRFDLLTPQQTGINFVAQIKDELKYNFLADPYIYNGGGVSVIDVNNDGLQDLFFTARLQGCRLYLNKGNFKFEDISEPSGVSKFSGLKTGTVVVDINADGWQDIYVCRTWLTPVPERRNLLFINNKDNTFSEQAAAFQLDDLSASQHANFFDYDRDGDLDCYVVNHPVDFKTINNLDQGKQAGRPGMPKNEWESDRFYRNDGGKFTDLTTAAGLQNRAFGLSTLAADFNHDGWPDLFVGNDFVMPDFLYINNQNGTFTDRAAEYFKHTSNHTMGVDYADLNNDGLSDLIALDMLAEPLDRRLRLLNTMQRTRDQQMITNGYGKQVMRNVVQLNNGNLPFSEIGCLTGMYATEWSWAPLIADYDHDGNQDVFISNGIQRDLNDEDFFAYTADSINATGGVSASRFPDFSKFVDMVPSKPVHNYMFQNLGRLEFSNVSSSWGFTKEGFSNGAVYADLDNDGDLDLVTNNLQAPPSVYENKCVGTNKNNWLQIKCKGTAQNPFGIGAKIKVFDANNVLILAQEMTTVRGFYSSVEPIIQVGLGNQTASKIEIEWLEGRHQELAQTFVNQRIILDIQQASVGARTPALPSAKKLWEETPALEGLNFTHQENQFEDFDREKLLPYRFSRRGPCTAVGDLDQNGTEDIYFGGASGQTGQIFLQNPNGSFRLVHQPAFEPDRLCEDTGCLLFDADGDKDLDLYVVSGGNESPPASHVYQDRLYLNDGKGLFLKSENSLPKETGAGSAVCAIDFNKDGATDLVVGGSCMPGMFPNPEESMLLLNDGTGKFANKTEEFAPLLKRPGIVTAIQVADVDKDGSQDIIIAGEWMPITILKWTGAKFEESTQKLGLEHTHGIWRSLTVLDVDQDGDLDIIAGNIGLNTRFKASIEAPLRLFAQDFDKNGSLDPVMVQAENGIYHPVIHREALAFQMPTIRRKFTRNTPYASAPIESILDPELILSGTKLKVETLVSQWFENSNGRFHGHNLPQEAQLSAVTKILADDLNGDHNPDLLVLGNDYGMETETYQLDASNGLVLLGNGRGGFLKEKNGIGATGEVRSAAKIKGVAHMEYLVIANNNAPIQVFKRISSTN